MMSSCARLLLFACFAATARAAPAGGPLQPGQRPAPPASHAHAAHLVHHQALPAQPTEDRAEPFPLNATRLIKGTVFSDAQDQNSAYLQYLEMDRLLYQFRRFAGLPNTVAPYGGWESPSYVNGLINGYLSQAT